MSLVSNAFLLFVAAAVVLYYLVPGRFRWMVLLVFSYLYYVSGNAKYLLFIVFSTVVTYCFGLAVERLRQRGTPQGTLKKVVALGIVLNLGMLGVVKYTGFFVENLNLLFHLDLKGLELLFPLGISFYTFQSTSYLLDVYWKKSAAEHNIFRCGGCGAVCSILSSGMRCSYRSSRSFCRGRLAGSGVSPRSFTSRTRLI